MACQTSISISNVGICVFVGISRAEMVFTAVMGGCSSDVNTTNHLSGEFQVSGHKLLAHMYVYNKFVHSYKIWMKFFFFFQHSITNTYYSYINIHTSIETHINAYIHASI